MPREVTLRVCRVAPGAELPRRMSAGASGLDLAAAEPARLEAGAFRLVRTGLAVEIPEGYEGQVRARSGLAAKHGIGVLNGPGTIDADYRGEIRVILFNFGDTAFEIERGDRIAQLVIGEVLAVRVEEAERLDDTERGDGGFGHTGVSSPA